ncbi:spondin-1-like isoform X2 [Harmonia axyridis]|uniref:spondin-1-like isoform X2 n=1 Tax=Harmonia axyridis TaxID=115357 RepID=UPI001E274EBE|nr:spondin-1-like isoform X2 [Harmonia axyridis]
MKKVFILLTILLILREIEGLSRCNRTPDGILRPKNPDGMKYIIDISDDPTSYVAEQTYTVNLKSNPVLEGKHMFKEFILSVEQENVENQLEVGHSSVGYFRLADHQLSKFSIACENTITQTNSVSKDSIQVYWIAPPTGSGCVAFRATVVESKESWFSEDGLLTKIMCEEVSENEDVQPEVLDDCCACDEAKYELVFEGLWTRNTHPKDYPSNIWYTKLGDIVGASHGNDQSFWNYEEVASQSIKTLGERGDTRSLEKELKEKMGKTVRTVIKANGLRYPNITGKTFAFFRVDSKNHLVSIVTKITPSPDWILGVSNFELCHHDCTWAEQRILNLYPWDIGTDDAPSYNSPNQSVIEPKTIQKIRTNDSNSPFYDPNGKEMKPFAKLSLTRLKTYKKECTSDQATTVDPSETTTEEGCSTTEWSDWSPCSVTCGKGMKYQERQFVNPEDEEECKDIKDLRKVEHCNLGKCFLPTNDTRCELTEWGEWSSCSATCGNGTRTHDKKFKNPEFAELCELNDPSHLQENEECNTKTDTCEEDPPENPRCLELNWGYWSICNVTCGEGVKTRLRSLENDEKEEIEQLGCKNMEIVTCYEPQCAEEGDEAQHNVGGMDIFNQVTTEIYSQPFGPVANCKVSEYSIWGPCEPQNGECGRGWTYQHRQILQHQMNGGKPCPRKLMRKKRCFISCNPEKTEEPSTTKPTTEETVVTSTEPAKLAEDEPVDCVMSNWSQWSPCSVNCGDSAIQQRTRSIRVYPRNNGKPCGPRLDEKKCPLPLACSDKGY